MNVSKVKLPDKCETSAFPREAITRNIDISNLTVFFKGMAEIFWGCAVCKIVHLEGNHPFNGWGTSPVTHFVFLHVQTNNCHTSTKRRFCGTNGGFGKLRLLFGRFRFRLGFFLKSSKTQNDNTIDLDRTCSTS